MKKPHHDRFSSDRKRISSKASSNAEKCKLCEKLYTAQNKPVKICLSGHTICQLCVKTPFFRQQKVSEQNGQKIKYICPFCQSPLRWIYLIDKHPNLAEGFQIQEQQSKIVYRKPEADQKLSSFEKLTSQNYKFIMGFLSEKEKINLASTNMFLRYLLMQSYYWGQFEISDILSININSKDYEIQWKQRMNWIQKYFPIIKPEELRIMIRKVKTDQSMILFFLNVFPWVNKLTLYCQSIQIHLLVAKACPEVVTLNVSSQVFSDELFEKMVLTMNKIKHFEVIKDDPNFTAKNLSKRFPSGLQRLVMKVHMIQFKQIAILAKTNPDFLTELQLDLEQCSEENLIDILESLTNVQVLKLYHMQNIHVPQQISNVLSTKVRQLYLSKAYEMPMKKIIEKIAAPKLLTLDFTEVCMLNDQDVLLLAKQCPYLRRLNISWCNKVSEAAISTLIESCLYLQTINLTGVKCLTNKVFKQYDQLLQYFDEQMYDLVKHQISKALSKKEKTQSIDVSTVRFIKNYESMDQTDKNDRQIDRQINNDCPSMDFSLPLSGKNQKNDILRKIENIKSLRNAKELTCISCNGVSDKILKFIYLIVRKVNTINYYSTQMGLFAYDEFGQQTWL